MERKFTDEDIVKALGRCENADGFGCPFDGEMDCVHKSAQLILDLINRQKAEIESLKEAYAIYEETTGLKWVRAEAIKEFADRLTNNADLITVNHFDSKWAISQDEIDNLVKEMTGEDSNE